MTRAHTAISPLVPVDDPLWSARKVREFLDVSDKWLRRRMIAPSVVARILFDRASAIATAPEGQVAR